jgi:hypothetical protein
MSTRDDLIAALRAAGQFAEAIWLGQRALADRERVQGGKHPDSLRTGHQLAEAYLSDGQAKAAISLLKRVVADLEKALGPRDPETLSACSALARASHSAGKMTSAVQLHEQVRAGYAETVGADHRLTLAASLNLARAHYSAGRRSDGAKLLRETAERCELHLPPGDPLTASALESLRNITGTRLPARDGDSGTAPDRAGSTGGNGTASKPGRHRTSR